MAIFLHRVFFPTIPDYFPFCVTSKYTSVSFHWMVVCVKRLIRGRIVMGPSCAIFILFLSPFKPSLMCFSFVVCVSKDRSFEASHWRPARHVRPPDANFSFPPQSFRLQPFSAFELLKQPCYKVRRVAHSKNSRTFFQTLFYANCMLQIGTFRRILSSRAELITFLLNDYAGPM